MNIIMSAKRRRSGDGWGEFQQRGNWRRAGAPVHEGRSRESIIMGAPKGATGEMGGERWRERCGICKARRSHLPCTHSKAKDKRPARRSRVDSRGR